MYSFERRCVRGDMIEVFKMFSGLNDLNVDDRIRGHNMKKKGRLDQHKTFFSF